MKIVLEIPDNKVSFIMELIDSIPFIKVQKTLQEQTELSDSTDYLLSSSVNEQRLAEAIERSRTGMVEYHNLIE